MNIFEKIKAQVRAEDVATYLLGKPVRGMYRYPGEKTPSVKLYLETQSFFDFGRACGGDVFDLWMHVRHCDVLEALRSIQVLYGIPDEPTGTIQRNIIIEQKRRQETRKKNERDQRLWREKVSRLHDQIRVCESLLRSGHVPPMSDVWCFCVEQKQLAEYGLDALCGICG
ncbi:hypothetical protein FMM80_18035 [Schaedlerella arabinosiphila]|jgi:hypothetical protein|uniref:Zinc finger CHC2-type domain-containing protein n=1 Tax=Schaedlerella arabinosiphila TaxID=2044587 RepID=A0A9X5CA35_9FIRM|nr:hypothetical protein [Schaedlerella arabinosiphila]KAI4442158.1 hypothetical protein C824_004668 [Schaedlerella arabinosiphila]NDO70438.1 hypothetical protein [Schaedlerella arabinosiphila]